MSSTDYDVVIIGAGMSGLAAGIRLALYDKKVCLLERHQTIGGLNSFYRFAGRNFDVGLHAMTNYAPRGTRVGPLARILRHLRFAWEEFALVPQIGSSIAFPDVRLHFTNDFEFLVSEIASHFTDQIDGFRTMVDSLVDYDGLGTGAAGGSAREFVARHITDPLLREMIFCPLFYYGGAREHDLEFGQFCIMFRSIFLEGFARPYAGVRLILKKLLQKFKSLGGSLRLRASVAEIVSQGNNVERLILADGSEVVGKKYLSSAGWDETLALCPSLANVEDSESAPEVAATEQGRLAFVETISVLDREPQSLGHRETIVFFNDSPTFHYECPQELVDLRSGVICSPNNFDYDEPLGEGMLRITALANFDRWASLGAEEYRRAKLRYYDQTLASAMRFVPDFRRHVIETDMFTPLTVRRFTGKQRGAIYGAPDKKYDGRTPLENLYLCGTDQGMVGIIGAIVSGITIANQYLLK
ncbi:MAG: phytoene desaturase family protein [Thermoguttaceae bacterium]